MHLLLLLCVRALYSYVPCLNIHGSDANGSRKQPKMKNAFTNPLEKPLESHCLFNFILLFMAMFFSSAHKLSDGFIHAIPFLNLTTNLNPYYVCFARVTKKCFYFWHCKVRICITATIAAAVHIKRVFHAS